MLAKFIFLLARLAELLLLEGRAQVAFSERGGDWRVIQGSFVIKIIALLA